MFPILNIGPLAIQTSGLIIIISLWLGITFAEKHAKNFQIAPNDLYNLIFYSLVAGILGARISYVLQFPDIFKSSPLSIISLNPSLLDPIGGIITGLIIGFIFIQKKNIDALHILDALTPMLLVIAIALPLSRLASGNGYGTPTSVPWGVDLWGSVRHPVQIYEIIAAVIILIALFPKHKYITVLPKGIYFAFFTASTSASTLFLDAYKADTLFTHNGIRTLQLIAWLILAISLLWIGLSMNKSRKHLKHSQT